MSLGGLSIFDFVRPPLGFRTVSTLATTYSTDLVSCLALLVALDGVASEKPKYDRISGLRAMQRLKGRVAIVAQQNRVEYLEGERFETSPKLLALFDAIFRLVPFNGREQAFHPKVIVARQRANDGQERYVLTVGSRNLTGSQAWDMGLGLVGTIRSTLPTAHCRLPTLPSFVSGVCALVDDKAFAARLGSLQDVAWELPAGIDRASFAFHPATRRTFEETELAKLPSSGRVLLVSPFLTKSLLSTALEHFEKAPELHLLSSQSDLDQVFAGSLRKSDENKPGNLTLASMTSATDDPALERSNAEGGDELAQTPRGLHAKVFCTETNGKTHALVGSANLTSHAWLEKNWEAFLYVRGSQELADDLWAWAKSHGTDYTAPDAAERPEDDVIDVVRNELATRIFTLLDRPDQASLLTCTGLTTILRKHKCVLRINRFTTPGHKVVWPAESQSIELPECEPAERTTFLAVEVQAGSGSASWIQNASVSPPIAEERDDEAFVDLLGIQGFLSYLRTLANDTGTDDSEDPDDETDHMRSKRSGPRTSMQELRLEELLHLLNRGEAELNEFTDAVERYRELFEKRAASEADTQSLRRLLSLCDALAKGTRLQWT